MVIKADINRTRGLRDSAAMPASNTDAAQEAEYIAHLAQTTENQIIAYPHGDPPFIDVTGQGMDTPTFINI